MRLFCIYSIVCCDVEDEQGESTMPAGTDSYFIHYVGDERERWEDNREKDGFLVGDSEQLKAQLQAQGKSYDEQFYLDLTENAALVATFKIKFLGPEFVRALQAYANGIQDESISNFVNEKADNLLAKMGAYLAQ